MTALIPFHPHTVWSIYRGQLM